MAHILIIEDNADLRWLYQQALEMEGYLTESAANGAEALSWLRSRAIKPNLILLDLMMPLMDGWEFVALLRQEPDLANIPILVCSAVKDRIPQNACFIRKPVDLDALLSAVRGCL